MRKHLDLDISLENGQVAPECPAEGGYLSNVQPWRDAWVWESVAEEIGDHRRRGYGAIVTEVDGNGHATQIIESYDFNQPVRERSIGNSTGNIMGYAHP